MDDVRWTARSAQSLICEPSSGWIAPWTSRRTASPHTSRGVKTKAANATINRELAALKGMFRLAERAGRVAQRPYVEMLHEANVKGFLEWSGFREILKHLPRYLVAVLRRRTSRAGVSSPNC